MSGHFLPVANGTDMYYTVDGPQDGILMLLIHGWTCDVTDWAWQIAFLVSLGFRVAAMDLRGHGRSTVSPDITAFDPITLASDAAFLLRHLLFGDSSPSSSSSSSSSNDTYYPPSPPPPSPSSPYSNSTTTTNNKKKALVMGHSLGGTIATELATAHPDLIQGLIAVDPSYYSPPKYTKQFVSALSSAYSSSSSSSSSSPPQDHHHHHHHHHHHQHILFDNLTASLFEAGSYVATTPHWIKTWHAMRAFGVEEKVRLSSYEQMGDYLLPGSEVEYIKRMDRRAEAEGKGASASAIPRLILPTAERSFKMEREAMKVGGGEVNKKKKVVLFEGVGHWIMKLAPERFNEVVKSWLVEEGFVVS